MIASFDIKIVIDEIFWTINYKMVLIVIIDRATGKCKTIFFNSF